MEYKVWKSIGHRSSNLLLKRHLERLRQITKWNALSAIFWRRLCYTDYCASLYNFTEPYCGIILEFYSLMTRFFGMGKVRRKNNSFNFFEILHHDVRKWRNLPFHLSKMIFLWNLYYESKFCAQRQILLLYFYFIRTLTISDISDGFNSIVS